MINQNLPAHYVTENRKIYMKYCNFSENCSKILLITKEDKYVINGDFLEKYLTLILKLKVVATGAEFSSINKIFYYIDYMLYISIGHGVSYFKHFLYNNTNYYGNKIYNKILIPPSVKLISLTKFYGWKDVDIIKINLPKWDKYINYINIKSKSIFIMFTWRALSKNKKIGQDYINNIMELINNKILII